MTVVILVKGWLNFSLYDENGVEDIESIIIDLGQFLKELCLDWLRGGRKKLSFLHGGGLRGTYE